MIRFVAHGETGLGFRGRVRALTTVEQSELVHRSTHCGGFVEMYGGAITMMKMVADANESKFYDCIWLINPPNSYIHLKTHLMARVDVLEGLGECK